MPNLIEIKFVFKADPEYKNISPILNVEIYSNLIKKKLIIMQLKHLFYNYSFSCFLISLNILIVCRSIEFC